MRRIILYSLWLPLVTVFAGCNQSPVQNAEVVTPVPPTPIVLEKVSVQDHQDLSNLFSQHQYDLATLDQGAPHLALEAFPTDLSKTRSSEKKRLFFLSLLPMVLKANLEVEGDRASLEKYSTRLDKGDPLREDEQEWLRSLARAYRIKEDPIQSPAVRNNLLSRVDTLPPELVLAQAANESAWGTSRFALLANNIFGEWTFTPGTGLVPTNRPEGATYEVRKFDNLYASLQSYMRNLNSHRAYKPLRDLRARMRHRGHRIDGMTLAAGLTRYSSRGQAYVEDLRRLMRQNKLTRFSDVELRPS